MLLFHHLQCTAWKGYAAVSAINSKLRRSHRRCGELNRQIIYAVRIDDQLAAAAQSSPDLAVAQEQAVAAILIFAQRTAYPVQGNLR
ncbi:hypothetical protein D3C80_1869860 [compost metagenome]